MISIIRKHQKILMLVVALLTIIAFAWLYNPAEMRELGGNIAAVAYGRQYTRTDIDRLARLYTLAMMLGEADLVSTLTARAMDENQALNEFIANLIVLRHEAAALGVEPGTAEAAARLRQAPAFQNRGTFDPSRFEAFASERLGALGMTTFQVEEVMRDALRLERLRAAVGGGLLPSQADLSRAMRAFQKASLLILEFPLSREREAVSVTDEEVQDYFNRHRQSFTEPEKLVIEIVSWKLKEPEEGFQGRERVARLQELAGEAQAFAEAVPEGEAFGEWARQAGLEPRKVGPFSRDGQEDLPLEVVRAAFLLPSDRSVSDVVQSGEEFFVFRVAQRLPPRELALEEVKPQIQEALRSTKAAARLREEATAAVARVRQALDEGKSPREAAAASGVSHREFEGIIPSERAALPAALDLCAVVSALLEPGQISNPLPAGEGMAAVMVLSRGTEAASAAKELPEELAESNRELAFLTWLAARRDAAGLRAAGRR